jgi:hypothetical protein
MRRFSMRKFLIFSATLLASAVSQAALFIPGNIAVFEAAASVSNTTARVLELNPAGLNTSPVSSVSIPIEYRFSGSATSTGYLSHSNDNTILTLTGVKSANQTSNVNGLNPRAVLAIDNAQSVTEATTYTANLSGNPQTRSATSLNNSTWFIGDQGGLYTNGSVAASPTGNFRGVKAFGGAVYGMQASGTVTNTVVGTFATPSGSTFTGLPGLANNASAQDFYFVQSGANGLTFDQLYVLSATSNTVGSIQKYSLGSGTWTAQGTATTTTGGFGLAARNVGGRTELYTTTGQGALTANSLLRFFDTAAWNAPISLSSPTTIYTAAAGTILKGVDFAPVPEPGAYLFGAVATLMAGAGVYRCRFLA